MYMYLNIFHVDTSLAPSQPYFFQLTTKNIIDYIFSIYRFTYVSKVWDLEPKDFNTILNKYIEDITEEGTSDGFTEEISQVHPNMNAREQFDMLGTVSNYHALRFPSLRDAQKIKTPNISLYEHIAMPEHKRYIPASPRNCIIYFIKSGEKEHLRNYIKFLAQYDHIPHFHTDEPPHKKAMIDRTGKKSRFNQSEAEISQSRADRNDTEVEYWKVCLHKIQEPNPDIRHD